MNGQILFDSFIYLIQFGYSRKLSLTCSAVILKSTTMDGKTKAIVAHITLIGWIVALVLNQNEQKDEFASFYIRQMLGLILLSVITSIIPIVGWILWIVVIVFWVMSLIGAAGEKKSLTPVVGHYFQDWFKAL